MQVYFTRGREKKRTKSFHVSVSFTKHDDFDMAELNSKQNGLFYRSTAFDFTCLEIEIRSQPVSVHPLSNLKGGDLHENTRLWESLC